MSCWWKIALAKGLQISKTLAILSGQMGYVSNSTDQTQAGNKEAIIVSQIANYRSKKKVTRKQRENVTKCSWTCHSSNDLCSSVSFGLILLRTHSVGNNYEMTLHMIGNSAEIHISLSRHTCTRLSGKKHSGTRVTKVLKVLWTRKTKSWRTCGEIDERRIDNADSKQHSWYFQIITLAENNLELSRSVAW